MPNPCAFCGAPDQHHRVEDAIMSRFLAGERLDSLMYDYGMTMAEVGDDLRKALRRRLRLKELNDA